MTPSARHHPSPQASAASLKRSVSLITDFIRHKQGCHYPLQSRRVWRTLYLAPRADYFCGTVQAMEIEVVKLWLEGIGLLVASIGGVRALIEYRRRSAQDRLTLLLKMQEAVQSSRFTLIRDHLETGKSFSDISKADRGDYAQIFENVALLRNAGFLRRELAHYMFGFEALRCWRDKGFWVGMEQDKWWRLLSSFAAELEAAEGTAPIIKKL